MDMADACVTKNDSDFASMIDLLKEPSVVRITLILPSAA